MSDMKPSNAKVYDRPDRKGPSPILLAVILLAVVIAAFFVYRAMVHPAAPQRQSTIIQPQFQSAFRQVSNRHG